MLLRLLTFWLFPIFGMMFAAGAVVDAGAMGGGDAGVGNQSADAGGDDGSSGVDDGTSETGGEGDGDDFSSDASADNADDAGDEGRSVQSDATGLATKGFTPEDKKLLALAQKVGPKEAQRVRQLLFAEKRLQKVVPGGVKAVAELVKTVNEFGGVEGVQQLQADLASRTESDELFARADPRWVESGFEQNPDAALKLFTHTLDFVAEKHPEHYDHLMAKVISNDLSNAPIHDIYALLSGMKDNPQAQQLAKQLAAYYNSRRETARNVPEKKVDAQAQALSARESKVQQQEMGVRYTQINTEILPVLKADVGNQLRADMKRDGLDVETLSKEYPAEWRNLLNEIHQKLMAAVRKDARFLDNYNKRISKGELKRAAELINQKHKELIPSIVREVRNTYGVFRGKRAGAAPDKANRNAGGGHASAGSGFTRVSSRPANSLIDWSKTTPGMQMDGKYILNDGKKVQVVY